MSDETRYVRKDVLNTTVDEDLILFDEQAGTYYATSEVGAAIWAHLAEPQTPAELCNLLSNEYDVDPQKCEIDVREFLDTLLSTNLITSQRTK